MTNTPIPQVALAAAANTIGAVQDDRIPGLWHAPGYPELTTGQLLAVAGRLMANVPIEERGNLGMENVGIRPT